jgi:hypothetical protein
MYPGGELDRLATRKALIRARISVRRLQTAEHARRAAKPLRLIDRIAAAWRHIGPWVKLIGIPAGVVLGKRMEKRGAGGKLSTFLKYAPLALQAMKLIGNLRRTVAANKAAAKVRAHAAAAKAAEAVESAEKTTGLKPRVAA